jgi:hypothetical protein
MIEIVFIRSSHLLQIQPRLGGAGYDKAFAAFKHPKAGAFNLAKMSLDKNGLASPSRALGNVHIHFVGRKAIAAIMEKFHIAA